MQLKHLISILYVITAAAILACGIGCSNYPNHNPWSAPPGADSPHSIQTNLYGRLDGWQPVSFEANPFSSLIQHTFCQEGGDYDPDVSSDGKWICFSSLRHSPNPDLFIKQTFGSTVTRLTSDPASEIQPCFSPDNTKVAYASNRTGSWDIWVVGVDGANPVRMTDGPGDDIHPSFSPDGKYLVYCSYGPRSAQWELWIVSVANPSMKKWIGYGYCPEWNPNASIPKIAFQLARYRGTQWFSVWTVDFVDGEAKYPTVIATSVHHACICPSWSPDGSKLAYGTISRGVYDQQEKEGTFAGNSGEDIWIIDLDGRNNLQLTQSDASNFSPTWAPDGRVMFCSDRKEIDNIWSVKPYQVDFTKEAPAVNLSQHPQSMLQAN